MGAWMGCFPQIRPQPVDATSVHTETKKAVAGATVAVAASEKSNAERRYCAEDGHPYTEQEFQGYYGHALGSYLFGLARIEGLEPPDYIFSQCDSNRFVKPPPGLDALFWQRALLSRQDIAESDLQSGHGADHLAIPEEKTFEEENGKNQSDDTPFMLWEMWPTVFKQLNCHGQKVFQRFTKDSVKQTQDRREAYIKEMILENPRRLGVTTQEIILDAFEVYGIFEKWRHEPATWCNKAQDAISKKHDMRSKHYAYLNSIGGNKALVDALIRFSFFNFEQSVSLLDIIAEVWVGMGDYAVVQKIREQSEKRESGRHKYSRNLKVLAWERQQARLDVWRTYSDPRFWWLLSPSRQEAYRKETSGWYQELENTIIEKQEQQVKTTMADLLAEEVQRVCRNSGKTKLLTGRHAD